MAPYDLPSGDKGDLDALVAAVQLLLSDQPPALQYTVISRALPQLTLMSPGDGTTLKQCLRQVSSNAKELSAQMDGSSGLGVLAVRNLKLLVDATGGAVNVALVTMGGLE